MGQSTGLSKSRKLLVQLQLDLQSVIHLFIFYGGFFMSIGSIMQIEHFGGFHVVKGLRKKLKQQLHRRERRKIKQDLEYVPQYKRYTGWEY